MREPGTVLALASLLLAVVTVARGQAADTPAPASGAASPQPPRVGHRGPGGYGIFPDAKPPTTLTEKDVIWRIKLPDEESGYSSPIVIGDKVIMAVECIITYALTQSHPEDQAVAACMREQLQVDVNWPQTAMHHPHKLVREYLGEMPTEEEKP